MKVLYGIQGTGHGHISRAKALLPELCKQSHVDVLISGYACQLDLDDVTTYRKRGISLIYDHKGGVAVLETLRKFKPIRFLNDIQSIDLESYDLVISDYEPVSSWAAHIAGVPSVALSHQAAFLSSKTPRPERQSVIAEQLLQRFAPTDEALGFHFKKYDDFIEPPLIREEIQQLNPANEGHLTVYLPAWDPAKLARLAHKFRQVDWHIFSPQCSKRQTLDNAKLHPVSGKKFIESLKYCSGVITSAGFEMCAEAMYLGKRLLAVPIRNQYEQQCNAAALEDLGITILQTLEGQETAIWDWIEKAEAIRLTDIADPSAVTSRLMAMEYTTDESPYSGLMQKSAYRKLFGSST